MIQRKDATSKQMMMISRHNKKVFLHACFFLEPKRSDLTLSVGFLRKMSLTLAFNARPHFCRSPTMIWHNRYETYLRYDNNYVPVDAAICRRQAAQVFDTRQI